MNAGEPKSRQQDFSVHNQRLPQLDGLRGVAILLVVVCH